MKDENDALGPPPVVTTTPTAPSLETAGVIQVIVVLSTMLSDVAAIPPNVTAVAPVKFVPVIVTLVPPILGPDNGEMSVMLEGIMYVKDENTALGPPPVVTITSTAPSL